MCYIEGMTWNLNLESTYPNQDYPKVSLIIPAFNNAEHLGITIESLLHQKYPDFEIIVIDGGSIDRTLEIVKSYRDPKIRLYSVSGSNRYEMINKGLSIATGEYINIIFPGDYYIYDGTLERMMGFAIRNELPDLVYCGCLLREADREVKILNRPLTIKLLKAGQQPTSLQSIWFKKNVFHELGKFNTNYSLRGGYEFLCRFIQSNHQLTVKGAPYVLVDYDLRNITRHMVIEHFYETWKSVYHYFGWISALRWLYTQKDTRRYVCLWLKSLKAALGGE